MSVSFRMSGQKLWTRAAVAALLVLTAMAAEGGKGEAIKTGLKGGGVFFFFFILR